MSSASISWLDRRALHIGTGVGMIALTLLLHLTEAARDGRTNLMPPILDAANACATLSEITGVFRRVFGEYQQSVFF